MQSPYKGLMPYSEADAPFFFGRAAEQEIIIANMNVSRLTLLYGASGVGKSSVLRAGIAHQLRQDAQRNLNARGAPEFAVVVFSSWRDDPVAGLIARVDDEVKRTLSPNHPITQSPRAVSLVDSLNTYAQRVGGDLYIILDQFEEYFLYHPDDSGEGSFAYEFARVLNREDLRVNFLLAIREDALAKLDRFKGRIPNLFDNYLRMEHLDTDAAREAIIKPLDEYNRLYGNGSRVEIEPALVDAVLEQTRAGQVIVGEAGRGAVERDSGDEIETPYLQLVMTRLWDEEQRAGSHILHFETLEKLGGAEKIVRTHLDTTMNALTSQAQDVSANIFNFLVTPSGTKIAHTARDLADYSHVPQNEIAATLEKLSGGDIRILRPVAPPLDQPNQPRYEIFHDVLGAPILDWRARFVQQQEKIESEKKLAAEKRRVQRLRFGLIGLSLLLLAVIALAIFAFTQRQEAQRASVDAGIQKQEAERQKADALAQKELAEQEKKNAEAAKQNAETQGKIARSGELAALAFGQLTSDPERALLLAWEAANTAQTTQAEDALRTALLDPYRLTFKGKGDAITDARITSDGKYVVTLEPNVPSCGPIVAKCGSARIWDAQSGVLVTDLQMPKGASKIDLSSDGKYLVTANDDAVARVWEIPSGKLVSELKGHEAKINDVHFSPDGKQVVTASDDQTARVWNTTSGSEIFNFKHPYKAISISLSPDGKVLATSLAIVTWDAEFESTPVVYLWSMADGNEINKIITKTQYTGETIFSPDSQFLATWSGGTSPTIWHTATGNRIADIQSSDAATLSLVFSPNGKYLLTGHQDGTLRVYDALTGFNLATLLAHGRGVNDVKFSPNGKIVISAGADNRARWWLFKGRTISGGNSDFALGRPPESILEPLQDLNGHSNHVNSVAFGPDGQSILTASDDGTARLWHVSAGNVLEGHTDFVKAAAYSPDGKQIATASKDGAARIWDAQTRETLFELRGHTGAINRLVFSPDGSRLVTASDDKTARVWDTGTGKLLLELRGHEGPIVTLAMSPDGKQIATGSKDLSIRLWDTATGEQIVKTTLGERPIGGDSTPRSLAYSPDGKFIAAANHVRVQVFDSRTGEPAQRLRSTNFLTLVAFSADGQRIFTASGEEGNLQISKNTVQIWNSIDGKKTADLRGHSAAITGIVPSPDGKFVLTASADKIARVWDANSGKLLHELRGHTDAVSRASFSPDGRFILTASNDKTARLWETATGKLIETLYGHTDILTGAAFSPDGKTILTAGDNTARVYECDVCVPLDALLRLADARITRELMCEERVIFLRETIDCP